MAKKSTVVKEQKKLKLVQRQKEKRDALRQMQSDEKLSAEERWDAMIKLQKLPRNSSPSRITRRCEITGRPRGVYRKFGLGRTKLREAAMRGDIPGLVKASW